MKKFKMLAIGLLTVMTGLLNVNAEEVIQNESALKTCVSSEKVCKIGQNIQIEEPIDITGEVTLDLNGYSITTSSKFSSSVINLGLFIVHNGGTLTVNDSVGTGQIGLGDTNVYAGILLTKKGGDSSKVATLVVNGGTIEGYYYAISGNGSRPNTNVTINGGTLTSKNETYGIGIYHPQAGTIKITGGTIKGVTGIEIRSGKLEVTGGTIISNHNTVSSNPNGSGVATYGAGIAIAQHTTKNEIDVTINGGTITGYAALYESNPQENDTEAINKINIQVTGGTFTTVNGGTETVYSECKTGFITGGTYSTDVKDYIATGLVSKKVGNTYTVGTENEVNITEVTNGTVKVDKTTAVVGETVTITVTPNEGYELTALTVVDKDGKSVEVNNNSFTMPNSEVTVTATLTKVETTVEVPVVDTTEKVEEVTVGVKESEELEDVLLDSLTETLKSEENKELAETLTNTSAVVEVEIDKIEEETIEEVVVEKIQEAAGKATIATYFDITVAVKNASNGELLGNVTTLTKEIELMILLPEELKNTDKNVNRTYYVMREHNGQVTKLPATLSKDGNYLVFKSNEFSTYALAYNDAKTTSVSNPQTSDGIGLYVVIASISLLGILGTSLYIKRKNFN